jgi:hypothetical protein
MAQARFVEVGVCGVGLHVGERIPFSMQASLHECNGPGREVLQPGESVRHAMGGVVTSFP